MLVAFQVEPACMPIANMIIDRLQQCQVSCIIPTLSSSVSIPRQIKENVPIFRNTGANLVLMFSRSPVTDLVPGTVPSTVVKASALNGKVYCAAIASELINCRIAEATSIDILTVGIAAVQIELSSDAIATPESTAVAITNGVLDVIYSF